MGWYILRRVAQMIPVFIGATLLVYAMVFLLPGDPVTAMFGEKPVNEGVAEQIRSQYNLDKPFLVQYLLYLKGVFGGDLGLDFSKQPVIATLMRAYPTTVKLALMAIVIETVVGVVFGVIAGLRKGGWFDSTALVISMLLIAVPTFVMGRVLQVLGNKWSWLPPTTASLEPTFNELLLPAAVLAGVSIAYVMRLTRTSMAENATADYVRTARAKGLSNFRVNQRHILRNSLIPVVTFLGTDLGFLMGGAIVTETIFNVKGVGWNLYMGILKGHAPTVVSLVTVLVLVFIVANLIVDLLYALIDPRIRLA